MSLRTNPRHTLIVQNFTSRIGQSGQKSWDVPDGTPITVKCNVFSLEASESTALGLVNKDVRYANVFFGGWPGNQHSKITHKGSIWQQVGPVVDLDMSPNTSHIKVIFERIGSAP